MHNTVINRPVKAFRRSVAAFILMLLLAVSVAHGQIFVGYLGNAGEFNLDGTALNASLLYHLPDTAVGKTDVAASGSNLFVSEVNGGAPLLRSFLIDGTGTIGGGSWLPYAGFIPDGMAASGSNVFVTDGVRVGEYSASGATVNASLISGLSAWSAIAVSGSNLFVAGITTGTVGEFTTSGETINASLITGLKNPQFLGYNGPSAIAVSGSNLFVANESAGTIGEYTTSGETVNAALITGLNGPSGLAIYGSNLYVANYNDGTIGEYTLSGTTVDASLITGLDHPTSVAVVPEPVSCAVFLGGIAFLLALAVREKQRATTMIPLDVTTDYNG
ncbi:MAG TPA: hypothetical protein VMI53_10945 [Opitutaceae bacterium]|nr:hypothetical protein [Opitutaceae bacterium]